MKRTDGFRLLKRLLAAGLASLLVLTGAVTAQATEGSTAVPGIGFDINYNLVNGQLPSGTSNHMVTINYAPVSTPNIDGVLAPGTTFEIKIPSGITIDQAAVTAALNKNKLVEKLTLVGDRIHVEFLDSFEGHKQIVAGQLELQFTVDKVEASGIDTHEWEIAGTKQVFEFTVLHDGDQPLNGDVTKRRHKEGQSRSIANHVEYDRETGKITLKESIANYAITFKLYFDTPEARDNVTISDTLPTELKMVADSVKISQDYWDENGLNKTTETGIVPTDLAVHNDGFSFTLPSVRANSKTVVEYRAVIADLEAFQAALQAKIDAVADSPNSQNVSLTYTNNAFLHDTNKTANGTYSYTRPAAPVDPGTVAPTNMFGKYVDVGRVQVDVDESGNLATPVDVTYRLGVDLTKYKDKPLFAPAHNVIIVDELPAGIVWNIGADFINVTGAGPLTALTEATGVAGDSDATSAFASDENVGKYVVEGNKLYVNVGRNLDTKVDIEAKAQIVSVTGAGSAAPQDIKLGDREWTVTNKATFHTGNGDAHTHWASSYPHTLRDRDPEGETDNEFFQKNIDSKAITVNEERSTSTGIVYDIPVKLSTGWSSELDLKDTKIVDYIDHRVFDVSDLSAIQVEGTFGWYRELTEANFNLSLDDDRNLIIEPKAEGWPFVTEGSWKGHLDIIVTIPTKPLNPGRTVQIVNQATLFGQDEQPWYRAETTAQASNAGSEAEVRKSVENGRGGWGESLVLNYDADGNLLNTDGTVCDLADPCNGFMYMIEVIGHDGYNGPVTTVNDVLPEALEFVGFANEDGSLIPGLVNGAGELIPGSIDIGQGMQATLREDLRTIEIGFKSGVTKFGENNREGERVATTIFKVRVKDDAQLKMNRPIVNVARSNNEPISEAYVTPSTDYPLLLNKVDGDDASVVITDKNARFTVVGPLPSADVITENAYVLDGEIVVDVNGEPTAVTVEEYGFYNVIEVVAPKGYILPGSAFEVYVPQDGMTRPVALENFKGDNPEESPDPEETPDPEESPTSEEPPASVDVDSDTEEIDEAEEYSKSETTQDSGVEGDVIEADDDAEDGKTLSKTGTNAGHLALGALITVLLGALFLGLARRRPREG